ncbi:MAG: thioredoxin domain-containing protein, partial [Thermodesulfobacteriota bacterium]
IPGFLEDYAYFIWGLLELVQTSEGQGYRDIALRLAETVLSEFADPEEGGFFQTPTGASDPLVRLKKVFDDALPSDTAVMLYNLVRLYGPGATNTTARKHLQGVAGMVRQYPQGALFTLFAASFLGS